MRSHDLFAVDTAFKPKRKRWPSSLRKRMCNSSYLDKGKNKRPRKLDNIYMCVSNRWRSMVKKANVIWAHQSTTSAESLAMVSWVSSGTGEPRRQRNSKPPTLKIWTTNHGEDLAQIYESGSRIGKVCWQKREQRICSASRRHKGHDRRDSSKNPNLFKNDRAVVSEETKDL